MVITTVASFHQHISNHVEKYSKSTHIENDLNCKYGDQPFVFCLSKLRLAEHHI